MNEDRTYDFTEGLFDFPRCNHSQAIEKENIGYTVGITDDGFPFEAELTRYEYNGCMHEELAIVMADMGYWDDENEDVFDNGKEEESLSEDKVVGFENQIEMKDYTVLTIGMLDNGQEEDSRVIRWYVDYVSEMGLVEFTTNVMNGSVFYLVDELGNDLVQIRIGLVTDDRKEATTPLSFRPFYSDCYEDFEKEEKRKNFKVLKGKP